MFCSDLLAGGAIVRAYHPQETRANQGKPAQTGEGDNALLNIWLLVPPAGGIFFSLVLISS